MSWEIKGKDNTTKFVVEKIEHNDEWMQERYVTVTVESPCPINFAIADFIIYRGERFEINYDPGKIKSAPRFAKGDAFRYENVKFNSLADELTRCDFLDVVPSDNQLHFTGLPKFSFYGGVKSLADRIQANLDRAYGKDTWQVVIAPEFESDTEINVSVDTIKVSGALEILVNDFKTYYTIKGRTLTIGAAGVPANHLFKYGKGNGLYEIEENAEADQAIVTRLRAYGSTRNIPHRYYNSLTDADGVKLIPDNMAVQYLMLPEFPYTTQDPYIDSPNIGALGVREGTIFFDGSNPDMPETYPSIEGMTAEQLIAAGVSCNATGELDVLVGAEQMTDNGVGKITGDAFEGNAQTEAEPATFKVTIKDVGFDINDHIIEGNSENPTISFKSGMLGGRDFEIVECAPLKSGNTTTGYELELNRVYDEDIKLWFPYKDYNAKANDKFVLLNIKMPEVYIKAASQLLKERAQRWLEKNDYSRSIYAPKIDENFMARQHDAAMASGGTIKSLHDTLTAGMQLLFEDEDLGIDAAVFIDRLTIIEGEGPIPTYEVVLKEEKTVGRLDKMQNQIDSLAAGQGSGGYNASQLRALIDAYGSERFLSKIKSDRTPYDLSVGGKLTAEDILWSREFIAGLMGWMIDRRGNAEFESIKVRSFMEIAELITNRLSAIEGDTLLTEADTIEEVTDNGDGSYTLRLHEKWEGYFTAQIEHNVIKGIFNNITTGLTPGEGQHKVNNAVCYTSWMNVISVDAANNTIDVILYPDDETPAGKNFPPEPMMRFARWGNSGDSSDPRYLQRQECLYLSSTEGRIMKLFRVTKPIPDAGNVAACFGTIPGFLCALDPRIEPGSQGIYVKDVIAQNFFKVDYQGRPVATTVDRGHWTEGVTYYDGTEPNPSGEYERSLTWHLGHGWLCNSGGVATADNSPRWNSTYWTHTLGDPALALAFNEVDSIVDPDSPECPLSVKASYMGSEVTGSTAIYYDWTRRSIRGGSEDTASDALWNAAHANAGPSLQLVAADMNFQYGQPPEKLWFTVTATLHDPNNPNLQPQQAQFFLI